jgi:DNA-binding MarR family transcriptional regulator
LTIQHELDAPPWARFESTLMATSRALRRVYDSRLAALDLNLTEASILCYVNEHGPITQTQLASRFNIGRAASGSIVDRLASRQLLDRRPDESDGRVWLVATGPSGDDVARRVVGIDRELREELRRGISRTERRQLAQTLLRLQENLGLALDPR